MYISIDSLSAPGSHFLAPVTHKSYQGTFGPVLRVTVLGAN